MAAVVALILANGDATLAGRHSVLWEHRFLETAVDALADEVLALLALDSAQMEGLAPEHVASVPRVLWELEAFERLETWLELCEAEPLDHTVSLPVPALSNYGLSEFVLSPATTCVHLHYLALAQLAQGAFDRGYSAFTRALALLPRQGRPSNSAVALLRCVLPSGRAPSWPRPDTMDGAQLRAFYAKSFMFLMEAWLPSSSLPETNLETTEATPRVSCWALLTCFAPLSFLCRGGCGVWRG
jgi:hypothetical protein